MRLVTRLDAQKRPRAQPHFSARHIRCYPSTATSIVRRRTRRLSGQWVRSGGGRNVAKEDRGFASMNREKQREIASKGGKAAHEKGTAHEWTSEEAREAGRKGGMASHRRRQGTGETGGTDQESQAPTTSATPSMPVTPEDEGYL